MEPQRNSWIAAPHKSGGRNLAWRRIFRKSQGTRYTELDLADDLRLTGYMFVEATSRIQDVLNNELAYFAVIDDQERVLIVNKAAAIRPFDK
jgi:hypothetical protein